MIDHAGPGRSSGIDRAPPGAGRSNVATERQRVAPDRGRAKRTMIVVTLVCALVGLGATGQQLVREGWRTFVERAPGVGGTASPGR
jgi:hypothetical protein